LAGVLRSGKVHSADGALDLIKPLVDRYRRRFQLFWFRGDAAFAKPEIYEYCESKRVTYFIRLSQNETLKEMIRDEVFPRVGFIVTNSRLSSQEVIRTYNGRANVENRIKEAKNTLRWDKTSCHKFEANQARLKMGLLAYNLLQILREFYMKDEVVKRSIEWLIRRLVKVRLAGLLSKPVLVGARGLCLSASPSLPGSAGSWLTGFLLDRGKTEGVSCPKIGKTEDSQRSWREIASCGGGTSLSDQPKACSTDEKRNQGLET
jgi:hypothetical protein